MIEEVHLRYFKRFEDQKFDLKDTVVLAGPNNAGKTSLIQAIATWHFAFNKWLREKGKSRGKQRTGVAITRKEFLSVPVRELNLLWHNTSTALRKHEGPQGAPRVMSIALSGRNNKGKPWTLEMEFRYSNPETLYAKPVGDEIPDNLSDSIVHVPSFSGINPEETIHVKEYQDWLIGQGKPGDIIRNLLAEVRASPGQWEKLREEIKNLFGYFLLEPQYEGRPFILCEYLPGIPPGQGHGGLPKLDIASSGSGFLQTLMLFAFFYARPSAILLFDEPDAHLHIILQKQIYDRLRQTARERNCQLIIATHSEILIDNTDPEKVISFYGKPHILLSDTNRDQVREALKRLSSLDITRSEEEIILYVEGDSDFSILHAWAKVLKHPAEKWFTGKPYHQPIKNDRKNGADHFFALQAIHQNIKGLMLLDGDKRTTTERKTHANLLLHIWPRCEIENYLVHPDSIKRFIENIRWPILAPVAIQRMQDELPPAVMKDPLDNHDYLNSTPASKTLLPKVLDGTGVKKKEYYQIAEQMKPEEMHDDIRKMLDTLVNHFGI